MSTVDEEREPPASKLVLQRYHFKSQSVFAVGNEPVAVCVAGEKLLMATMGHNVEVRNLDAHGRLSHTFCTVDMVKQMLHSEAGQYVATLEVKASRQNLMTHIRLYFNWQIDTNGLPMRARIAGRVTPSSQSGLGQLEMVELPLQKRACFISCCKATGNLAVSCCISVSIFYFCIKIHDISKMQFHDMEHLMEVYLTFPIKEVALCEDFLACMSASEIHVVRLDFHSSTNHRFNAKNIARSVSSQAFTHPKSKADSRRRASVPTNNSSEITRDSYFISWNCSAATKQNWALNSGESAYFQDLKSKLNPDSWPLTIHLPSLQQQTVYVDQSNLPREITGPMDFFPGHPVKVEYTGVLKPACDSVVQFETVSLLYKRFPVPLPCTNQQFCLHSLQFSPFYILDNVQQNGIEDSFKESFQGAILQTSFSDTGNPLHSHCRHHLKHLEVFFSGPNEGYLFNLLNDVYSVSSYPFTCNIQHVALESNVLHAISSNGVETYSIGHWQRLLQHFENNSDIEKLIWHSSKDQVVLLGTHSFLNITMTSFEDGNLILLANANGNSLSIDSANGISSATIYALQCPPAEDLYQDLLDNNVPSVGDDENNATGLCTSSNSYLLHEAQAVMAVEVLLNRPPLTSHAFQLFQDACLQLGNNYLMSQYERVAASLAFYKMSKLSLEYIIQKLLVSKPKLMVNLKRLCSLLSLIFIQNGLSSLESLSENTANAVLQVFLDVDSDKLSLLFLSGHFNGYDSAMALEHIQRRITSKLCPEDAIAACILCIQSFQIDRIPSHLALLTNESLLDITAKYPNIWLERCESGIRFSSFCQFLQRLKPNIFIKILHQLMINEHLPFDIVSLLCQGDWEELGLLPRTDALLLLFLEELLMNKLAKPWHCFDAVMTLATLYLKCLANVDPRCTLPVQLKPWSPFGLRQSWLNGLPPFLGQSFNTPCRALEWSTDSIGYELDEGEILIKDLCPCLVCNDCLLRLQSLLCSDLANIEVRSRVAVAIHMAPSLRGALSLQILCSLSSMDAADIIFKHFPSVLLEYCRDTFGIDASLWKELLNTLLSKCDAGTNMNHQQLLNTSINGIVANLAEIVTPTELVTLLPKKQDATFLPHVKRCIAKHQAKSLRDIIITKGFELKTLV